MTLQVVISLLTGGAERYVVSLAEELARRGEEVEVLVFDRTPTPLREELASRGVAVRHTLSRRPLSPLNFFTFAALMTGRHYDVIHTHLIYPQLWTAVASLLNFRRKRLFTTEHSTWNRRRALPFLRPVDRFIYSRYHRVLCISETTRRALVDWLRPRRGDRFVVATNGVDIERFRAAPPADRAALGLSPHDIVVMMVGRMDEAKDQPTLVRAVEHLPPRFKCVLVGGGETILRVAGTVRQREKTIFTANRSDVPALVRACDIYVQSSHYEGLPTTVLEAMAAGRPVLGSDVAGVRDVVPALQLFPEGDDARLAEMIGSFADDRSLAEKVVSQQEALVSHYSLSRVVDRILDIYRQ